MLYYVICTLINGKKIAIEGKGKKEIKK